MNPVLFPPTAALLLALASGAILLSVVALQYLGDLPPCPLCVWQRWPYVGVAALGLLGWRWQPRVLLALAVLALLVGAGLGVYHLGVEEGWWALPAGCAAGASAQSVEDLRRLLAEAPPACDQVSFTFLGLSLAGWNVVASLALAAYAIAAALGLGRDQSGSSVDHH
ncbi:MAG: disulfide bond formation protein [Geminicoccaceae bacterium]|nr:disulfide bond formation protein [Geminicoccaceae bacterium]